MNARPGAYETVAEAIRYLNAHRTAQPRLDAVAAHVGLSPSRFQRLFAAWAGVSPKQYLQYLTREDARRRLRAQPVLDAALSAGLSGSGRLHDLMVTAEGVTPGEYRAGGVGLAIRYGRHDSPFGRCLVATTPRGICKLAFADDDAALDAALAELRADWPQADIAADAAATAVLLPRIFPRAIDDRREPLRLLLRGSAFQVQVWQALLAIPAGDVRSYADVAAAIGAPTATRAAASAIARNDIGYLIPCHRVIRASGDSGEYRWGGVRKQAMLAHEAARRDGAH